MSELIVLKQKPIIEFSAIESRGLEVAERIGQMNIETIEATESSRSMMKKMRAELNKELDVFESQRKMIHGAITKPYKDFTSSYELNIKGQYTEAVARLKEKISSVEDEMLERKKGDLTAYFKSKKGEIDFVYIEDIGLNITLSAPDKKLKVQIDAFIEKAATDIESIQEMDNAIRIESLYKTNLDLSLSITTVMADIKREKEAEEKREAKKKADQEAQAKRIEQQRIQEEHEASERVERKKREAVELERQREIAEKNAAENETKEAAQELERIENQEKQAAEDLVLAEKESQRIETEKAERAEKEETAKVVHTMQFKVCGNIEQLKKIKEFMKNLGVSYE